MFPAIHSSALRKAPEPPPAMRGQELFPILHNVQYLCVTLTKIGVGGVNEGNREDLERL